MLTFADELKQVAQLSQRDRAAGWLVMAKSGRLELKDTIYGQHRSIFNHCDVFGQQRNRNRRKKRKIRAVTPLKVIQGHRGRYQSKARMRLPISD